MNMYGSTVRYFSILNKVTSLWLVTLPTIIIPLLIRTEKFSTHFWVFIPLALIATWFGIRQIPFTEYDVFTLPIYIMPLSLIILLISHYLLGYVKRKRNLVLNLLLFFIFSAFIIFCIFSINNSIYENKIVRENIIAVGQVRSLSPNNISYDEYVVACKNIVPEFGWDVTRQRCLMASERFKNNSSDLDYDFVGYGLQYT